VQYSIEFKIECIQSVILSKHANESIKSGEIVHLVRLFLTVQYFYCSSLNRFNDLYQNIYLLNQQRRTNKIIFSCLGVNFHAFSQAVVLKMRKKGGNVVGYITQTSHIKKSLKEF